MLFSITSSKPLNVDEGAVKEVGAVLVFKYQGFLDVCLIHVGK